MEPTEEPELDARKQAFEFGWNWFKYHAEQRMTMIRFYLVIVGVCLTGYFSALKEHPFVAVGLAVFGALVSLLFWALDGRVSKLVKLGEGVLAKEQEKLRNQLGYDEILVCRLADSNNRGWFGSYKKAFRALFIAAILLFLVGGYFAATKSGATGSNKSNPTATAPQK